MFSGLSRSRRLSRGILARFGFGLGPPLGAAFWGCGDHVLRKNEGFEDFYAFRPISVKTASGRDFGAIWARFGPPLGSLLGDMLGGGSRLFEENSSFFETFVSIRAYVG